MNPRNVPRWVLDLVMAIERSEDEHPKYFGDFAGGMQLIECPESRFLALVPDEVRRDARAVMHYQDDAA